MNKVYLDYNATTPVDPVVREAMLPFFSEEFGNPSSLHWAGAKARQGLDEGRERVARALSCEPREVVFTSGGTESINLAIQGVISKRYQAPFGRPHLITSEVEHQAVLQTVESLEKKEEVEVTRLKVDRAGDLDLEELQSAIRENTALISIQFVNNETGNIYPIQAIGVIARERGILFHTDAVQAVGKLPINLSRLPVDLLSFSSHKIYGPKGVGALYIRRGVKLGPLIHGGGQELEKRGGTENLPGIVGFGVAMERVHSDLERETGRLTALRDRLQSGLIERIPGIHLHGDDRHRVSNTLHLSFEGVTSEGVLIALDREGIAVSSGSACASGALEPSHVLLAMGVPREEAKGAVRFSLGKGTTGTDIEYALETVPQIVKRLRQ